MGRGIVETAQPFREVVGTVEDQMNCVEGRGGRHGGQVERLLSALPNPSQSVVSVLLAPGRPCLLLVLPPTFPTQRSIAPNFSNLFIPALHLYTIALI